MAISHAYACDPASNCIHVLYEDGRGTMVPLDPDNTDYQEYLRWLDEGNTPEPYVAPEPPAPPTPEEKLAASGLTVEELKALLGIK